VVAAFALVAPINEIDIQLNHSTLWMGSLVLLPVAVFS
jgi:hypothetical protein